MKIVDGSGWHQRQVDVDLAVVDEPVDQLVRELADVLLEWRDASRR